MSKSLNVMTEDFKLQTFKIAYNAEWELCTIVVFLYLKVPFIESRGASGTCVQSICVQSRAVDRVSCMQAPGSPRSAIESQLRENACSCSVGLFYSQCLFNGLSEPLMRKVALKMVFIRGS